MDTGAHGRPLPSSMLWTYAAIALPLQAIAVSVSVYLPQYYAKSLGMDFASLGTAFAIVRLLDLPLDPLFGLAMDRTRTRWGRYRLWLLIGAPLTMAAVYMLYLAQPGVNTVYVVTWLLVMSAGTSMLTLSHSAWAAALAPTYNERSRIFATVGSMGVIGATLIFGIPLVAASQDPDHLAVPEMGWFILVAIPIATFAVVIRTPEGLRSSPTGQRVSLREYLALLTHPSMNRIALAMLLFSLGTTWEGSLYLFYFTDVRGFSLSEATTLLIAAFGAGIVGAPALGRLSTRISKHVALGFASVLYATALGSLILVPRDAKILACIPVITTGCLFAGFYVLLRSMTADVADEIRLIHGKERSGLLYALLTLAAKLSAALGVGLTFNVMAKIGYDASAGNANTPEAIDGLRAAYLLGPIGFVLLGAVCMIGYKLGPARTAEVHRLLSERDVRDST